MIKSFSELGTEGNFLNLMKRTMKTPQQPLHLKVK